MITLKTNLNTKLVHHRSLLARASIPDLAKKRKHVELDTEEVTELNNFQFDLCPPCQWIEEEDQQQEEEVQEEETGYVAAVVGDLEGHTTQYDTDEDSSDDPDLPIKFRQSARMYKQRNAKVPSNELKENAQKREPKKGKDLSASQIALIDLGEILSRHKCDKGLFSDIVDWARHWSNLKPDDIWKSNRKSNEQREKTFLVGFPAT
jgi:thiol-disulfide isomerase/thioredoxin